MDLPTRATTTATTMMMMMITNDDEDDDVDDPSDVQAGRKERRDGRGADLSIRKKRLFPCSTGEKRHI